MEPEAASGDEAQAPAAVDDTAAADAPEAASASGAGAGDGDGDEAATSDDGAAPVPVAAGGGGSSESKGDGGLEEVVVEVGDTPATAVRSERVTEEIVLPGACEGSCGGWMRVGGLLLFGVVLPVLMGTAIRGSIESESDARTVGALGVVMAVATWLLCCCSLQRVWTEGIFCKPKAISDTGPLLRARDEPRPAEKRELQSITIMVNPMAGVQEGLKIRKEVVDRLEGGDPAISVRVLETAYAGHAIDIAREFDSEHFDALVAVGGDGTFHETINGMLTRPDGKVFPVGLIPGGSGNSFMMDLRLKFNTPGYLDEAARRIQSGEVAWIDVNRVEIDDDRVIYSVNEVTWGLVGEVGAIAEDWRVFGPARYDICGLWGVFKAPSRRLKLVVDGEERDLDVATAFVNQTQHFGKEMRAAPGAKLDDGYMDLIEVDQIGRGGLLTLFLMLPDGSHDSVAGVHHRRAKDVTFYPELPGVINIDGENVPYKKKFRVVCEHKRIPVIMPTEWDEIQR